MEGKRQLEKRDSGKRLSLDSSLMEYMDSNKCIEHLLTQLREQHRSLWREKLAVARLQREVAQRTSEGAMHEKLIHELEEERHLRLQSEKRLREVTLESECNRIQMRSLQQRFSRMEETVRSLLQSQGCPEQKKEETVKITVYQERLSEEERKHQEALGSPHMVVDEDSRSRSSCSDEGKDKTKLLLERLKALEAENSALALENENQREQYERCLDEVANQVVQALLTQKDLREECVKLKTRVFDLEQQNRTLSILFQQRVRPVSDLLLQKLHSRVVDLSSGDLISESGRSRSLTQSWTDTELHEHLQNAKSGSSALKRSGSGAVVSRHLCPHSCSSSELSLSSTCSEYSSGSSYTCQDGRHLEKRVTEVDEDLREDEEDIVPDSALPSHIIESNCQMRTLDSGIGTFPLPDSGTRSTGRYICQSESPEDTEPLLPLQPAPSTASSARAQTLEREVPSSADNQCSSESSIIHSISDPGMMTRGMQAPQSLLPKPTSSGKNSFQKQNGAESRPQTHPSFEYAEDTAAREPLPRWRGEDAATETQELKQVEETKDPENRLSKISLESFNKFNSNAVILLEKENAQSKVEGQKEEREKNEAPLSSSDRPVLDNLESLSDSLYDSFSSCVSQTSNDV
ncbi:nck-associated protein 5 isoform X6 [Nannospalax galili]|uniref:nck-associated protein 5 isoform X6 n=1 Tax=Nannospalax galili TaxID=1026970 RepID=UPI00111C70DD|nr:nck-associated protein 5 isoform X6 [Nannospalax galili]